MKERGGRGGGERETHLRTPNKNRPAELIMFAISNHGESAERCLYVSVGAFVAER